MSFILKNESFLCLNLQGREQERKGKKDVAHRLVGVTASVELINTVSIFITKAIGG